MKWIVDRIEADRVICETQERRTEVFAADELPDGLCEGDVLVKKQGQFFIDREETAERQAQMQTLFERLKKR